MASTMAEKGNIVLKECEDYMSEKKREYEIFTESVSIVNRVHSQIWETRQIRQKWMRLKEEKLKP
jgi:hypothetical protein